MQRAARSRGKRRATSSTPTIYRPDRGAAQVIAPGSYQLTAYSVANGEPLWFVRGLTCQPKSAPTISGGIVYFNGWTVGNDAGEQAQLPTFAEVIAAADANHDGKLAQIELPKPWQPTGTWRAIDLDRDGYMNEREWTLFRTRRASRNAFLAVKLGGRGDVTDTHVLWRFEKSRLTGAIEDYYASPVGVDGKVYLASEHGKVVVLRAAGDWEILAINQLDSDIYATPAIAEGQIYIRTGNALYAVGSAD